MREIPPAEELAEREKKAAQGLALRGLSVNIDPLFLSYRLAALTEVLVAAGIVEEQYLDGLTKLVRVEDFEEKVAESDKSRLAAQQGSVLRQV